MFVKNNRALLILSVLLFNVISIYTTKIGLSTVWSSGVESDLLSWTFSIAIGLMIIYITFSVAGLRDREPISGKIIAYILLASVSIFFNFNAFFTKSSSVRLEAVAFQDLQNLFRATKTKSEIKLREYFRIDELEKRLNSAESGMAFERGRPDKPGAGPIYTQHYREYQNVLKELENAKSRYDVTLSFIEGLENKVSALVANSPNINKYEQLLDYSTKLRQIIRELVAHFEGGYNIDLNLKEKEINLLRDSGSKEDLSFSLFIVFEEISKIFSGTAGSSSFYNFLISLFLGFLIDVPVFCAVVFSKERSPKKMTDDEGNKAEAEAIVFETEEEMWEKESV